MVLGLGSSKTPLRKEPRNSLRRFESFCRFLDFAERGTLVAVRVTELPTHGKSLVTACDTDVKRTHAEIDELCDQLISQTLNRQQVVRKC